MLAVLYLKDNKNKLKLKLINTANSWMDKYYQTCKIYWNQRQQSKTYPEFIFDLKSKQIRN